MPNKDFLGESTTKFMKKGLGSMS